MLCVVCPPGAQSHDEPALALNVTLPPVQNVVGPPGVIVAVGNVFTVTVVPVDVAEQPFAVTVTE
jgi:hypothetical protein